MVLLQQLINGLNVGATYALFALGLTLIWGSLRIMNMAHGSLFMWGAMFGVFVGTTLRLPLVLLLPVAMAGSGLLAVLIDVVAFRPLRRRNLKIEALELGSMIASIGFGTILTSVAERLSAAAILKIPDDVYRVETVRVGGLFLTNMGIVMFVVATVLTALVAAGVRYTKQGKALRAIAFDPGVAEMLGINVNSITMLAMFVAGMLAGAAGLLLGISFSAVEFTMGDPLLLKAFAIILLGGVGSIPGALIGGFTIAFVEVLAVTYLNGQASDGIVFTILVLVLLLRPGGIFGRLQARAI
jgi:branched-chain amino acid transport system permease protein